MVLKNIAVLCLVLFLSSCAIFSYEKIAQKHYKKAFTYSRDKDYDKALKHFTKAVKYNPENLDYRYNLAVTYSQIKLDSEDGFNIYKYIIKNGEKEKDERKRARFVSFSYSWIASYWAVKGDEAKTILNLKLSIYKAWNPREMYHGLVQDSEFEFLKENAEFKTMVDMLANEEVEAILEYYAKDLKIK